MDHKHRQGTGDKGIPFAWSLHDLGCGSLRLAGESAIGTRSKVGRCEVGKVVSGLKRDDRVRRHRGIRGDDQTRSEESVVREPHGYAPRDVRAWLNTQDDTTDRHARCQPLTPGR
jgi:hypothetical protein